MNEKDHSTFQEIGFLIRTVPENKYIIYRYRILSIIVGTIFAIIFSMFITSFSPILFSLNILKVMSLFTTASSFIYLIFGDNNTTENWQSRSSRKSEIIGRMFHVLKEVGLLLLISCLIFGLFHLTGLPRTIEQSFLEENPSLEFPLNYIPTTIELILIISIIVSLLTTQFTLIYWTYSRCAQYKGYIAKKKVRRINFKRFFISLFISGITFFVVLTVFLDELFISTKFPDILASWDKYDTVFASNPEILLVIELAIIVLLNIFYITDGLLANKFRTNFVDNDMPKTIEI
ncbi:MAG: hypothetical protein ACTSQ0_08655 [Candidatus Heimdallarchaeota archaeon]